ncbi:MAG: diadenylate cyclase CdaA [Bacteroidales bacterium]|nr:diadenylate cyclase CdaA [Bacteroidales bacterium]
MGYAIGFKDILDIFLVAVLFYQLYRLVRGTGVTNIFVGLIFFLLVWCVVKYFDMTLLSMIFDAVINVGAIALIILFQSEIRNFFAKLGSRNLTQMQWLKRIFRSKKKKDEELEFPIMKMVLACRNMAKTKTGALIVIGRKSNLDDYINTGDIVNADINTRLVENIFFKNSPLHDGAMIITNNRITAAGCILPVSRNPQIPRHLGLRHRSALGISENTDAVTIIVSEETGTISLAIDSNYILNVTPEELERILSEKLQE